jgi:hypothetical protein
MKRTNMLKLRLRELQMIGRGLLSTKHVFAGSYYPDAEM